MPGMNPGTGTTLPQLAEIMMVMSISRATCLLSILSVLMAPADAASIVLHSDTPRSLREISWSSFAACRVIPAAMLHSFPGLSLSLHQSILRIQLSFVAPS